ncbi:MAG: hypothetical protein HGA31_04720 [Candidatus Moranbacteria bacterium]|nr:hypothetical protein [Candidatus Moranbacteria bacterium]
MRTKTRTFRKGFSLGEVLLSVAVLVIGVLPIFATISHSLKISIDDQRLIVASGLAQEGVELVQNVRDNNVLHGTDTFTGWLPASGSSWSSCRVDFGDPVVTAPISNRIACSGAGANNYDLTVMASGQYRGLYLHQGAAGLFKRRIFLDYSSTDEKLSVVSAAYWGVSFAPQNSNEVRNSCNTANQCVFAETTLTAWR